MKRSSASSRAHRTNRFHAVNLRLEVLETRCLLSGSVASYGQLPLSFEPNVGQASAGADFVAHGSGYALALENGNLSLGLSNAN